MGLQWSPRAAKALRPQAKSNPSLPTKSKRGCCTKKSAAASFLLADKRQGALKNKKISVFRGTQIKLSRFLPGFQARKKPESFSFLKSMPNRDRTAWFSVCRSVLWRAVFLYRMQSRTAGFLRIPSSFSTPKAPSDWIVRLIRSRIPCSLVIRSREAARAASNAQLTWIVLFSFALVHWALYGQLAHSSA